jgi:hypothetical protein
MRFEEILFGQYRFFFLTSSSAFPVLNLVIDSSIDRNPWRIPTMRPLSLVSAALLSLLILPNVGCNKTKPQIKSCDRHNDVGFLPQPYEIKEELGQVYANCYDHPACTGPTDLETIQIDGNTPPYQWLWEGLSTTKFGATEQDSIIEKAIALANTNAVKPSGKEIVNIAFFWVVATGNAPVYYAIYCKVTFARCSQPPQKKGMTWIHSKSDATTGTITVGCSGCDAYHGDTVCTESRPLLCIYKPPTPFQLPMGLPNPSDNQWSGGVVATTEPVAGVTFNTIAEANASCEGKFGKDWRVAEFHDGKIWNFQAYGGTVSAPTVPPTRFWVNINDQTDGNCWTIPSAGGPSTIKK